MRFPLQIWDTVFWIVLLIALLPALIALVSPSSFARLSYQAKRWSDSTPLLKAMSWSFDVDRYLLPFSRLLGAVLLTEVAVFGIIHFNR